MPAGIWSLHKNRSAKALGPFARKLKPEKQEPARFGFVGDGIVEAVFIDRAVPVQTGKESSRISPSRTESAKRERGMRMCKRCVTYRSRMKRNNQARSGPALGDGRARDWGRLAPRHLRAAGGSFPTALQWKPWRRNGVPGQAVREQARRWPF